MPCIRFGFPHKNSKNDLRKVKESSGLIAIFETELGEVNV